jgi:hypothetical protein
VRPAANQADELSWEDLDYAPIRLKPTKEALVQIG